MFIARSQGQYSSGRNSGRNPLLYQQVLAEIPSYQQTAGGGTSGAVAVRKSRAWSPPAPPDGQEMLLPLLPTTPVGAAPNTPIASRLSFGPFCFLPPSALGCYLSHNYLLVVVYFSCQGQGFQPKPRRGWSGPTLGEVSAGVKGVQGQPGNEVSDD